MAGTKRRNGGRHEKAQRQARIQEYTQRQAQIVAKAGKKWRTGRQEKAQKHAKKKQRDALKSTKDGRQIIAHR